MAEQHGSIQYGKADGNDYPEHERTYAVFTMLTKWSIITVAIILALMWIFLL